MKLPPLQLTPLQLAALDRIHFFEQELEKRGLKVRLCFEQKFSLPNRELLEHANARLKLKEHFPTFLSHGNNETSGKYEARFGSDESCTHKAADIAMDVLMFRANGAKILNVQNLVFDPVIRDENPQLMTQGLHANLSVYDEAGIDLFDHQYFYRANAERLLNLQYHAGLGFIQNPETLRRLASWDHMPDRIGLGSIKTQGCSVLVRNKAPSLVNGQYVMNKYLESRLSSANADPFVIAALELAAVYDTVTHLPELRDQKTITMESLERIKCTTLPEASHKHDHMIERQMQPWVERFRQCENDGLAGLAAGHDNYGLRQLLGDALYEGILQEYGKDGISR